jgi:hypothetical protein
MVVKKKKKKTLKKHRFEKITFHSIENKFQFEIHLDKTKLIDLVIVLTQPKHTITIL